MSFSLKIQDLRLYERDNGDTVLKSAHHEDSKTATEELTKIFEVKVRAF